MANYQHIYRMSKNVIFKYCPGHQKRATDYKSVALFSFPFLHKRAPFSHLKPYIFTGARDKSECFGHQIPIFNVLTGFSYNQPVIQFIWFQIKSRLEIDRLFKANSIPKTLYL